MYINDYNVSSFGLFGNIVKVYLLLKIPSCNLYQISLNYYQFNNILLDFLSS